MHGSVSGACSHRIRAALSENRCARSHASRSVSASDAGSGGGDKDAPSATADADTNPEATTEVTVEGEESDAAATRMAVEKVSSSSP